MAKLPAFQFYPGDWLKDPELKICSLFARGLLVDLLCIMFEAKHRGKLVLADGVTPWTNEQIVDAVPGSSREEKLKGLQELLSNGVLKRCPESGYVYSARQIRDEEIRLERSKAGSKGGTKGKQNGSKTEANGQAKHQAKSGSSSSSSSSSSDIAKLSESKAKHCSLETIQESDLGKILAGKLRPSSYHEIQFLQNVGHLVNRRFISEGLVQTAAVGCEKAKKPLAMFRDALAGNIKAAGGDLNELLQSLTTGGDDANEAS